MERRTIIAFLLIGLVTFGFIYLQQVIAPKPVETPDEITVPSENVTPEEPAPPEMPASPVPSEFAVTEAPVRDDIRVSGSDFKYDLVFTNRGASILEVRLPEYPEKIDSEQGVLVLQALEAYPGELALTDPDGVLPLDTTNYEVIEESQERVAFRAVFENGLEVTKEFLPQPGSYQLGVRVHFRNVGAKPLTTGYGIVAANRVVPEGGTDRDITGVAGIKYESGNVSLERKTPKKDKPFVQLNNAGKSLAWTGAVNRYFAVILQPAQAEKSVEMIEAVELRQIPATEEITGSSGRKGLRNNVLASFRLTKHVLPPNEAATLEFKLFIGPKDQDILEQQNAGFEKLVGYGTFGLVSRALLALLKAFYALIPNYGVGIILMTIVVKICLFPLTRKGQISMARMQKLQPLVRELQEKYKDDKQRQSREMMDLYRKHKANPMSGCLPLLFQLPIFWGLFRMLQSSIDLRQEGFFGWIKDLSQADTITHIGSFPVNILPVLMVISWVTQQWMMPKPADPQQAQTQKMMMIMPLMFGFMLYGMASGLTLYWLTSTFLGILEQKYIKHQVRKMEEQGAFAAETAEVAAAERPKPRRRK